MLKSLGKPLAEDARPIQAARLFGTLGSGRGWLPILPYQGP